MADSVKRVGLEFTSEGVKEFKESLKEVQKASNENYQAFKQLKSQWTENTKESQKLADRQTYLSSQTETYTKKVELLKCELSEMKNTEGANEKAIEKKKKEVEKAEKTLASYETSLKDVNKQLNDGSLKLKEFGDSVKKTGDQMSEAGKVVSVASAAIAGVAAASIAAAKDLDEGYDTIITKTGASGEALEALQKSADNVFSTMPVEMSDVGTAIGEVNTRFQYTGEELEELSKKFIKFSEINGTDLNNAIDKTDTVMMKFGVDSKYAGNVLDYMTKVGQDTGISMETLYNQLDSNSAILQEMGYGLSESISLLASFEENGVDAQATLTAMKKATQEAVKEGKSADEMLYDTIDKIKNAKNHTEALSTATEVFGSKAAPQMVDAIESGRLNIDDFNASMYDMKDVVENTYEETLDPWDEMKVATNDLKLAGSELASEFLDDMVPAVQGIADGIRDAIDWWEGLDDGTKDLIITIGEIIAILGPVLLIVGKIISVVGAVTSAVGAAGGAIAFLTSPIGIAIAVITALVTAGVLLYKNWDTVKEKCTQFANSVKDTFENMKKSVTDKFNSIKDTVKNAIDTVKGFLKGEISFPHIKTPHFKISGGVIPWGIGGMGTKPSVSVDWYAKAMGQPLIMRKPTIFGYDRNGNAMGGGEAGTEILTGESYLMNKIESAQSRSNSELVRLLSLLLVEMKSLNSKQIVLDSGELVGALSDDLNNKLYDIQNLELRGG